jgi:hypothetical protein
MTRALLSVVLLLGCSAKPEWRPFDAGPFTMQFPCDAERSAAVVRCLMSDGATYALTTIDKGLTAEAELEQVRQYVGSQPKVQVIDVSGFPVKWREVRQFRNLDSWLYYFDGKEYVLSVEYPSEKPPPAAAQFFARANVERKVPPEDASSQGRAGRDAGALLGAARVWRGPRPPT